MIVTRIHGGLGNQMFQYALGRRLSLATGLPLRFETGSRNPSPLGRFYLDRFPIAGQRAPAIESALRWRARARLLEAPLHAAGLSRRLIRLHRVYVQRSLDFDPAVLQIRHPVYLVGHWQSERYFSDIAATIRADFTPLGGPKTASAALLADIARAESVCVHVRRGDYASNPHLAAAQGVCGMDYYDAARRYIETRVHSPHFFVFSDDIPWCRNAFQAWCNTTFVAHNRVDEPHEDLRLMVQCRHFITGNSTFSWWAAWLGSHSSKHVITPLRWCIAQPENADALIPRHWVRI
jgi:hypothetical protein